MSPSNVTALNPLKDIIKAKALVFTITVSPNIKLIAGLISSEHSIRSTARPTRSLSDISRDMGFLVIIRVKGMILSLPHLFLFNTSVHDIAAFRSSTNMALSQPSEASSRIRLNPDLILIREDIFPLIPWIFPALINFKIRVYASFPWSVSSLAFFSA